MSSVLTKCPSQKPGSKEVSLPTLYLQTNLSGHWSLRPRPRNDIPQEPNQPWLERGKGCPQEPSRYHCFCLPHTHTYTHKGVKGGLILPLNQRSLTSAPFIPHTLPSALYPPTHIHPYKQREQPTLVQPAWPQSQQGLHPGTPKGEEGPNVFTHINKHKQCQSIFKLKQCLLSKLGFELFSAPTQSPYPGPT